MILKAFTTFTIHLRMDISNSWGFRLDMMRLNMRQSIWRDGSGFHIILIQTPFRRHWQQIGKFHF